MCCECRGGKKHMRVYVYVYMSHIQTYGGERIHIYVYTYIYMRICIYLPLSVYMMFQKCASGLLSQQRGVLQNDSSLFYVCAQSIPAQIRLGIVIGTEIKFLNGQNSCLFSNEPFEKRLVMIVCLLLCFDYCVCTACSQKDFLGGFRFPFRWPFRFPFRWPFRVVCVQPVPKETRNGQRNGNRNPQWSHHRSLFKRLIWKETWILTIGDFDFRSSDNVESRLFGNGLQHSSLFHVVFHIVFFFNRFSTFSMSSLSV